MLKITLDNRHQSRVLRFCRLAMLAVLLVYGAAFAISLLVTAISHPVYSPDSWSYYELSQTIFSDFFRIATWRSYLVDIPYSMSFPPLWPVAIGIVDLISGLGPSTGLVLAALSIICASWFSEQAGRTLFHVKFLGFAAVIALATDPFLFDEIASGRAIPLQLVLMTAATTVMLKSGTDRPQALAIGILFGAMILNRFDALFFVATLLIGLLLRSGPSRFSAWLLAAFVTTISPWIVYSLFHFGTLFASDNRRVALSVDPRTFVTDWYPIPPPTLFDDPGSWLLKISINFGRAFDSFVLSTQPILQISCIIAIAALGKIGFLVAHRQWAKLRQLVSSVSLVWPILLLGVALTVQFSAYALTGYVDARYFTLHRWWIIFSSFGVLTWLTAGAPLRPWFGYFAAIAAITFSFYRLGPALEAAKHNSNLLLPVAFSGPPQVDELRRCLRDRPKATVLFDEAILGTSFGALERYPSALIPSNFNRLSIYDQHQFLKAFKIGYLVAIEPGSETIKERFGATPVPCPVPLFEVKHG